MMKKLYDEIMAVKVIDPNNPYDYGINAGLETASKLAKKYDDEIERLNKKIDYLYENWNIKKYDDEIDRLNGVINELVKIY
jgi:hypothetical protein